MLQRCSRRPSVAAAVPYDGGMLEHRDEPLLTKAQFARRFGKCVAATIGLVAFSLALGAVGYHDLEGMDWVDSVFNAAMILTGMGPAATLHSTSAKLFATGYALYSACVLLTVLALLLGPLAHRILHKFHLELDEDGGDEASAAPPTRVRSALPDQETR
jgi:hypothetical protein